MVSEEVDIDTELHLYYLNAPINFGCEGEEDLMALAALKQT